MARPRNTVPTTELHLSLPVDLVAEVQLRLFSELQGRVPLGHMAKFFETAARKQLAELKEQENAGSTP